MQKTVDYLIVGGGIIGLTVARRLLTGGANVLIIEKESSLGLHASGRNSGVLHAGIYYGSDTLKARFCSDGLKAMRDYAGENNIEVFDAGKVVVSHDERSDDELERLYEQAQKNNIPVKLIDPGELKEIEPEAHTFKKALYSPSTAVIDPKEVLASLEAELIGRGVKIESNTELIGIETDTSTAQTTKGDISYGHLINCAGLYADKVAHLFGVGLEYRILPFKGLYYDVRPERAGLVRGLIYPAPDLRIPFLGVHFTKSVSGALYAGPTAIPVLGRENYRGLTGIELTEAKKIISSLTQMVIKDSSGLRRLAMEELAKFHKPQFVEAARRMVPAIKSSDLKRSKKVGIRAQLVNWEAKELMMDFIVSSGKSSTHVLNAVSPAFTCSFPFAEHVVEKIRENECS